MEHVKPTVGRIVHFYEAPDHPGERGPYAAIVTGVEEDSGLVSLHVFKPGTDVLRFHVTTPADDEYAALGECWVWPPR